MGTACCHLLLPCHWQLTARPPCRPCCCAEEQQGICNGNHRLHNSASVTSVECKEATSGFSCKPCADVLASMTNTAAITAAAMLHYCCTRANTHILQRQPATRCCCMKTQLWQCIDVSAAHHEASNATPPHNCCVGSSQLNPFAPVSDYSREQGQLQLLTDQLQFQQDAWLPASVAPTNMSACCHHHQPHTQTCRQLPDAYCRLQSGGCTTTAYSSSAASAKLQLLNSPAAQQLHSCCSASAGPSCCKLSLQLSSHHQIAINM